MVGRDGANEPDDTWHGAGGVTPYVAWVSNCYLLNGWLVVTTVPRVFYR